MITIVSHDAGGAEILSSWLRRNPQPHYLVLGGPAVEIFQRKLGNISLDNLESSIDLCDWVLCGTSWASDLEKEAIIFAKAAKKKVVAFLDHWSNYHERFKLGSLSHLPDEIWVGDADAEFIAHSLFPNTVVKFVPNPYFKDIESELKKIQVESISLHKKNILYVCEPIREHALLAYGDEKYWGYTEEDALQYFLNNINSLDFEINEIKIRSHPSESKEKYNWALKESSLVTETMSAKSLIEQIAEADIVVGCSSMAMVVALLAKRRVISAIPPGGRPSKLPQSEIEHLHLLVKNIGSK